MQFDYVIVGGGSAGAALAARLSDDPDVSVCLLEAGGRGDGLVVRVPAGVAVQMPGQLKINNWSLWTVPQPQLKGRRGFQPRGKALGGSSAIMRCYMCAATAPTTIAGPISAVKAGRGTRFCPISNAARITSGARTTCTAVPARCR